MVHQSHEQFQEKIYEGLVAQDAKNMELYESIDEDLKSSLDWMEMQATAVIMAQQNILDVQQELIHESLFQTFVEHHESEVFPLPLAGMFSESTKILKSTVREHSNSVHESVFADQAALDEYVRAHRKTPIISSHKTRSLTLVGTRGKRPPPRLPSRSGRRSMPRPPPRLKQQQSPKRPPRPSPLRAS